MNLALIGCGRWGKNILRTLESFPDVSVSVIQKGEPVPDEIEGVLIATPSATHAEIALPFIEKGTAVFIEKPMATSVADAERLREAAERSGALVFVGHIQLYNPLFLKARELVPTLGKLRGILAEGGNNMPRTDSSILWDWLPHHLTLAREVCGRDPQSVVAWGIEQEGSRLSAVAKFSFGDIPLISFVSWSSPEKRMCLTISGEQGTLVLNDVGEKELTLTDVAGKVSHPEFGKESPLANELQAFVETVRTGVADRAHLVEGSDIVRMIAAAEESMQDGGVEIPIRYQ